MGLRASDKRDRPARAAPDRAGSPGHAHRRASARRRRQPAPTSPCWNATAFVVAGVSAQHKSDVLNTTLLAQLGATKKYDREKQTKEWYDSYRTVLENVGWVVGAFDFKDFGIEGDKFTADEVVLKVLAAIATGNDLATIAETWEALKALNDDARQIVFFNRSSHGNDSGSLQISAVADSDDVAVMKLGAFTFSTRDTVTNLLWFQFATARTDFYQGSQTMDLNGTRSMRRYAKR